MRWPVLTLVWFLLSVQLTTAVPPAPGTLGPHPSQQLPAWRVFCAGSSQLSLLHVSPGVGPGGKGSPPPHHSITHPRGEGGGGRGRSLELHCQSYHELVGSAQAAAAAPGESAQGQEGPGEIRSCALTSVPAPTVPRLWPPLAPPQNPNPSSYPLSKLHPLQTEPVTPPKVPVPSTVSTATHLTPKGLLRQVSHTRPGQGDRFINRNLGGI